MDKKGFTLVELVIVIVIVGILSIISVPVYRGYVEKAMLTEGKTLIGAVGRAELAYHVEAEEFKIINKTGYDETIDIDARGGRYFNSFSCPSKGIKPHPVDDADNAISFASSINKADGWGIDDEFKDHYVNIEVYGQNNKVSWTLYATQWADGYMSDIQVSRNGSGEVSAVATK